MSTDLPTGSHQPLAPDTPTQLARQCRQKAGSWEPCSRTCIDAFGHEWLGHTHRSPGRRCDESENPSSEGLTPRRCHLQHPVIVLSYSSSASRDRHQMATL